VVSCLYAMYRAHTLWGAPRFNWTFLREDIAEGIYFSIGTSAATIYNDIDKVMLGRISFVAGGIYAAAYRIVDVSMTPIRSLASAAYPHFFRRGVDGMGPAHAYATTHIKRALLYSAALFIVLWLSAPLLPLVLGANYAQTALRAALASTASDSAKRAYLLGGLAVRGRVSRFTFCNPSCSRRNQYCPKHCHSAEVWLAGSRVDKPRVRWITAPLPLERSPTQAAHSRSFNNPP
jgi:hypothetical protein